MSAIRLSGKVEIDNRGRARIVTPKGSLILVPYPTDAPLPKSEMEVMGKVLFSYLNGREATVIGEVEKGRVFNARLATKKVRTADPGLPMKSIKKSDRFGNLLEKCFQKPLLEITGKLNLAGITTLSAFYHRLRNFAPEIAAFSGYLGVKRANVESFLAEVESSEENRLLIAAVPQYPVTRGVNIERIGKVLRLAPKKNAPSAPPSFPASNATPDLPSTVDLSRRVTAIKDQGMYRGTCVAHAVAALLEHEFVRAGIETKRLDLSEQYLFWASKQLDGFPTQDGTFIKFAMKALGEGIALRSCLAGVCSERDWKYQRFSASGSTNPSHDPPPASALVVMKNERGKLFAPDKTVHLPHRSIKKIKQAIAENHCVGLSVYTYHFWTDNYAWREGVISLPFRIRPDGAHAICLVGYRDNDESHRDGYFVFKNSWGTAWGAARKDPGYGNLPYRYLLNEAIEAWYAVI